MRRVALVSAVFLAAIFGVVLAWAPVSADYDPRCIWHCYESDACIGEETTDCPNCVNTSQEGVWGCGNRAGRTVWNPGANAWYYATESGVDTLRTLQTLCYAWYPCMNQAPGWNDYTCVWNNFFGLLCDPGGGMWNTCYYCYLGQVQYVQETNYHCGQCGGMGTG